MTVLGLWAPIIWSSHWSDLITKQLLARPAKLPRELSDPQCSPCECCLGWEAMLSRGGSAMVCTGAHLQTSCPLAGPSHAASWLCVNGVAGRWFGGESGYSHDHLVGPCRMKAEEVTQCSRVGGSLNQFQKSILQETEAKEVQRSSSLSNYTAVHVAGNSSKNPCCRGLLGPHRLSCPHSLAHRHTAELSECPSRSWRWIHQPPACPLLLHLWCACV